MKLAIVTRGDLPVPAVKGGAVESLIDLFINQNELYKEHYWSTQFLTKPRYDLNTIFNIPLFSTLRPRALSSELKIY